MCEGSQARSVLERLQQVPDGRQRRGRVYPQVMILAMWKRGRKYWQLLREHLGVLCPQRVPCFGTAWYWAGQEVVSLDGKALQGSKREERALQVLVMAGEGGRCILAQQAVTEGDE